MEMEVINVSDSYKKQIKDIKNDVRKIYDKLTRDLAKEAKDDMEKSFISIIDQFYDSYNPDYYVRTHNLYHMISKRPIYREDNGHIATIATSSLFMFDNYNSSPDVVYDLMWNQGHRGLPFQTLTPIWNPKLSIDGYINSASSPDLLMFNYINNWGDICRKKINKIDSKYTI